MHAVFVYNKTPLGTFKCYSLIIYFSYIGLYILLILVHLISSFY